MPFATLTLDPRSRVKVRTRAKGMLSALAHDLEIAGEVSGEVRLEGEAWTAKLVVPAAALRVAGTLKGDRLDPTGLSASDRGEVERRLRAELLSGAKEITVSAEGPARARGEVTVTLAGATARVPCTLRVVDRPDETTVDGRCTLSLSALRVPEVRAPLGAFKVADAVEVILEATLVAAERA